ncbi:conserved membrane hypothetical protein [Tenacibaculum litopenaei]|jgi:uncharacterized membrane protein YgdD (TMEM256/DUF423 family)|uniref:DUF423 domain-containing protein n=1 Tax=Tenacibaculum litopenaei TaxID=396016 RepID=UPI003895D1F4
MQLALLSGAIFGLLAVILGAFGAHALKKTLNDEQLKSFETGVKYQMYHAIVLLVIGSSSLTIQKSIAWLFIIGTCLFSFSIYGLVLSDSKGKKMKFLGPITPLGGLLLVAGWALLAYRFLS